MSEDDRPSNSADGGMQDAPRLVLASSSPRRSELLRRIGLEPVVRPTAVDEEAGRDEEAEALVRRLAAAKAAVGAAAGDGSDEVVIARSPTRSRRT